MELILDGNNFDDIEGFYHEVDEVFTKNLKWKTGHNLDAFHDLLRGGFGVHEYDEPITIKWLNYNRSKKYLGETFILQIIEVILDCDDSGHDCKLELFK